jgi:hypothetical protein
MVVRWGSSLTKITRALWESANAMSIFSAFSLSVGSISLAIPSHVSKTTAELVMVRFEVMAPIISSRTVEGEPSLRSVNPPTGAAPLPPNRAHGNSRRSFCSETLDET